MAWRIEDLGYRIANRWIFRGVSFGISAGVTALIGPNGAGKSTLLRLLAGIYTPTAGRIRHEGVESAGRTGYVPQFPGIYPQLTVQEYLERTLLWAMPQPSAAIRREQISAAIRHFRLPPDRLGRYLGQTERRQVALAELWLRQVGLALVDEPTAGLDPEERLVFWQQLSQWQRLTTVTPAVLVTTHLLSEVEAYANQVIVLGNGRILYAGSLPDFLTDMEVTGSSGGLAEAYRRLLTQTNPQGQRRGFDD